MEQLGLNSHVHKQEISNGILQVPLSPLSMQLPTLSTEGGQYSLGPPVGWGAFLGLYVFHVLVVVLGIKISAIQHLDLDGCQYT